MFRIISEGKYSRITRLWLTILIVIFSAEILPGKNYEVEIKGGVSSEVLDYENDLEKIVVRGGTSVKLSETFSFDFTTLRNLDDKTSSCTWNIEVKDISGFMDFTSGNYNLHFGSGLMMGKPSYSSKDPFTKKISIAKDQTISPSKGGNPEYSFYGAAPDFHKTFEDFKMYFIPFFSVQRRFISCESLEAGVIDSSLYTLNTKTRKSGNNTEPVSIINYGGVSGIQASELFNIQAYYFETDLKGDSGEDILWDRDKYYAGGGIDLIRNSGLFAEYADKNISFFIEPAVSSIESEKTVTDFALAWGIGIRNSIMNFAMKGKNCGTNFHSEYSSGSRSPERIWEARCGIYPVKFLETGFILYSEKDLTPSYNKDYIEGSIQEEIFAAMGAGPMDITLGLRRREHYSTDRKDTVDQGNLSAAVSPSDRFHLKIKTSAQKNYDEISYIYGGELKFLFLGYMGLSLGYTRIIINGEMPFYTVITPSSEHSSITGFRESGHGGSMNLRYKKGKNSFYIRGTIIKTGSDNECQIESALVLVF
ncbi:MAG TPA: hypothetical protein PKG60_04640 [Spirochaetota bacterium]|nr:hypothetical protein [Spirochaetota bacterium]